MKVFAKQSLMYDGKRIRCYQQFDVEDDDGKLLIDASSHDFDEKLFRNRCHGRAAL